VLSIAKRTSRTGERVVVYALFACAVVSVAVTVGIVAVLVVDAVAFFRESSLVEFLTGTVWAPGQGSGEGGQYGVLPLINGTLMIGVGAGIDYLAEAKPAAPTLIRHAGLEWAFRLAVEPKRLWRRYLFGNASFAWLLAREHFGSGSPVRMRSAEGDSEESR